MKVIHSSTIIQKLTTNTHQSSIMKLKQSAAIASSISCASLFSQHTFAFTVAPHNHQQRNIVTTSLSDRSLANPYNQQTLLNSNSFQRIQPDVPTSVRCYASSKKNESNFLSKAIDKIKDLNPFKKKEAITRKEQAKEEVSSSIDTMFKVSWIYIETANHIYFKTSPYLHYFFRMHLWESE